MVSSAFCCIPSTDCGGGAAQRHACCVLGFAQVQQDSCACESCRLLRVHGLQILLGCHCAAVSLYNDRRVRHCTRVPKCYGVRSTDLLRVYVWFADLAAALCGTAHLLHGPVLPCLPHSSICAANSGPSFGISGCRCSSHQHLSPDDIQRRKGQRGVAVRAVRSLRPIDFAGSCCTSPVETRIQHWAVSAQAALSSVEMRSGNEDLKSSLL